MLKIDIVSGFLGAGKTTFIQRLLKTKIKDEKVVLIENEYGEVSVDSDILKDTKIEIRELSQGCICCSLVGDFSKALKELIDKYSPDRVIIEPSGVGKLSDIVKAVESVGLKDAISSLVCIVDCKKAKMYEKNFGEFFIDQIKNAHTVILSRTDIADEEKVHDAIEIVKRLNEEALIVSTPISALDDKALLDAYEGFEVNLVDFDLDELECDDPDCECHHHHHHHHEEEDEHEHHCCHHHHDEEDEEEHEHHCCHNHHEEEDEEEHEHHCCHNHHDEEDEHEHHHHHHADEVFTSVGIETAKKYDIENLKKLLDDLASGKYGLVVRSKGIIEGLDKKWYLFNLTPEEVEVVPNAPIPMGKIVVIGSHINEDEIKKLF